VEEAASYADKFIVIEIDPEFHKPLGLVLRRAGSKAVMIGDYLRIPSKVDVIITNPPFSLGFEVAKKAVTEASHVVLLLRLNFLGSGTKSGRSDWLRMNPPDVYVLPNRPSFAASIRCVSKNMLSPLHVLPPHAREIEKHVGSTCSWRVMLPVEAERPKVCPWCAGKVSCSTTDATEYAWFVWHAQKGATDPRQLSLIPNAPGGHGKIQILADTPASERDSDE
jgi:hypothetical protein